MAANLGFLIVGLGVLVLGAELLVRGAARLATAAGMSPLVVGLTVVAYGTSTPELAVSVRAVLAGQPDIAVGNVVGSNILNVLFILGASALFLPLAVASQLVRIDVPLMIAASLLVWLVALDGHLSRTDGVLLAGGFLAYTAFVMRLGPQESPTARAEFVADPPTRASMGQIGRNVLLCVVALGLLVLGSSWFVASAVAIARGLGVSELVVGLTLVAAGTSMPEVATSLLAAWRGERDIAVGNVVGSNLFNLLAILGVTTLVAPGVPVSRALLTFDLPVMAAAAVACLPIFISGHRIARWEGALFLAYWMAYTLYLALASVHHDALPAFSGVMLGFVMPLTLVTLTIVAIRAQRGAS